mgnify:CR=1 FL=1
MSRKREVWHPADYKRGDVRAIQALMQYARLAVEAWDVETMGSPPPPPSEFEVKRALDWIINQACQTYDDPFAPGQPDVKDYVLGRRSVGLAIIKLSMLKPELVPE